MRIVDGEGTGSVVETHATPIGLGPDNRPRTAVIEAVIAHSERTGFKRLDALPRRFPDLCALPRRGCGETISPTPSAFISCGRADVLSPAGNEENAFRPCRFRAETEIYLPALGWLKTARPARRCWTAEVTSRAIPPSTAPRNRPDAVQKASPARPYG
jgi:hypothetical protein